MKFVIFALTLILSTQAFAANVIMDCNVPAGDLQRILITEDGGQLTLIEEHKFGGQESRPLSLVEYNSTIKLYAKDADDIVTMTKGGRFDLHSGGFGYHGGLDCGRFR
jgi:hypothetical protein